MKRLHSTLFSLIVGSYCLAQIPFQLFQQALLKENGEGDLKAAVPLYKKIMDRRRT